MVLLWRKCLVKSVRGSFPSVKSIDPDDGSTLGSREFSTSFDTITFDSRHYMYFDHMGPRTRQAFSNDYSKVVASKSDNSGSGNVGTIADILMNPATFMTWRLSCRPWVTSTSWRRSTPTIVFTLRASIARRAIGRGTTYRPCSVSRMELVGRGCNLAARGNCESKSHGVEHRV